MAEYNYPTDEQIEAALAAIKSKEITDIYYVGCGASLAVMFPNQYAMDRLGTNLNAFALNAAEFVTRNPARLGENVLVVLCSMAGKTPETVAAAKFAREAGTLTVGLTNIADSPLAKEVEYPIFFEYKPHDFEVDHMGGVLATLTFSLLAHYDNSQVAKDVLEAMPRLPAVVKAAVSSHSDRILDFAESHKRDIALYTMGSGTNYGPAYLFAFTIFQEMLWMHSAPLHSNEYFHGPFELTDFDLPIMILRSIGSTKAMDDRAIAFAQKHSQKVTVLDSEELGMGVFSADTVEYLEHLMFGALMRNYANRLGFTRGHPLTVRRYMWQIDY